MMENELPEGWIETELGEITSKPQYGWTSKAVPVGDIKYLRTTDLTKGKVNWETVPFCEQVPDDIVKYQLHENDIVISRAGSVGFSFRIKDVPENVVFASYLIRFRAILVEPKFIEFFLQTPDYWRAISEVASGIALQNINAVKLSELKVPLPPLAEQKRIVAKLDEAFQHIDTLKAKLARIPELLKTFRQAVLTQAVTGKLTEEWREGKNLLSKEPTNKFEIEFELLELPELPESWIYSALGNFAQCSRGKFTPRPRNDPRFFNGEYPFMQIGDLPKQGGLTYEFSKTLNEDGIKVSKRFPAGTIVIAIVGATIGNTGILKKEMYFPDSLIGINSNFEEQNYFLEYFLRTIKLSLRELSYAGGGQPNIKLNNIQNLAIAIPPLEEQKEIVKKVEALFAAADAIEARFQRLKAQVDQLPQALLAKAFRGELVPHDPKDEPASVLLEKIKAAKASAPKAPKGKKTEQSKQTEMAL